MVSSLDDLEVLVRALGLEYSRKENTLLLSVPDEKHGSIGVALTVEDDTVRVAAPLDVEPFYEALNWFLAENFSSPTYKYAIDPEGFIAVVYDLPAKCVKTARDLRAAIVEVVEGARRVLDRTEEEQEKEA